MASQTSSGKKAIPLAAFVADVDQRREQTGIQELPRNTGARRTPAKQVLLNAINDAGGRW